MNTYIFILLGLVVFSLARLVITKKVNYIFFFLCVPAILNLLLSYQGMYIGPVGDSLRYVTTIDSCSFSLSLCGSKPHEIIWGAVSSIFGPLWGLIYGLFLGFFLFWLSRFYYIFPRYSVLLLTAFSYIAYQVSNGMAEFTYCLIMLIAVLWFSRISYYVIQPTILTFFHFGNITTMLIVIRKPFYALILGLLFIVFLIVFGDDIYSLVNKAGALRSFDTILSSIGSKISASIERSETGYGERLLALGFPYKFESYIFSFFSYLFPVINLIDRYTFGELLSSCLSTLFSLVILLNFMYEKRRFNWFLFILFFSSTVIFSLATYVPGVGLRHKVPTMFFMVCFLVVHYRAERMLWSKYAI